MKLGLAAWGLRDTPEEEKFALAAKLGVNRLEVSIAGSPRDFLQLHATAEAIRREKQLAEQYGVDIACGCTGNDFTAERIDGEIRHMTRVLAIAAELGLKQLRIFAGFASDSVMDAARTRTMLAALRTVRLEAERRGIVLMVETHGGVACENGTVRHYASVSTRVDFWPEILATGVSMLYDPANLYAAGVCDPPGFLTLFRDHIAGMHWKDFVRVPGGVRPAACGEGMVDWRRLLALARSCEGPVLIEYEPVEDVAAGMRRSLEFLHRHGIDPC